MYKWTAHDIASMTPYQQLAYYDKNSIGDTLYFATEEEYWEWLTRRA